MKQPSKRKKIEQNKAIGFKNNVLPSKKTKNTITFANITPILSFMSLKELFRLIKVNKQFSIAVTTHPIYQTFLLLKKEFIVRKKDTIPDFQKLLLSKKNILEIGNEVNFERYSLQVLLKKDSEFIKKMIVRNNVLPASGEIFFASLIRRLINKQTTRDGMFSLNNCAFRNNCNYLNSALKDIYDIFKIEFTFNNQLSLLSIPNLINYSKKFLQVLNLSHNGINDSSGKFLFSSLQSYCPFLKMLDISFNNLTDSTIKSASDYFSSLIQLKKFNLSHNAIGSLGASMLFQSLTINNSLELLNISFNGIDNTLFEKYKSIVEQFFSRNKKLITLYYCGNYIPPSAVDIFTQNLIANTKLAYVYLDNNQINDEGLEYLSSLVSYNAKLTGLHLAYNKFTHVGISKLLEQIAWRTLLVELDLSQNNLSEQSIKLIVNTLSNNKRIGALNLSYNTIKDGTMIAQLIRVNTCLKNLNLSNCHMGLECKKICEALEVNKKLAVIDLSVNEIGKNKTILSLVSKMLKENYHLRFVYLNENYLTDDDLISLSEGLKNNRNLNNMLLKRNKIELKKNMPAVFKNLRKNDHIKIIDLEENPISDNVNLNELKKVLNLNGTTSNIENEI